MTGEFSEFSVGVWIFFFAGERHQLNDDGKEKKKAVNLNVRRQNESVADFSFQIQIGMCE